MVELNAADTTSRLQLGTARNTKYTREPHTSEMVSHAG